MVIKTVSLVSIIITLIFGMIITVNWDEFKQYFRYLYDTFFKGR